MAPRGIRETVLASGLAPAGTAFADGGVLLGRVTALRVLISCYLANGLEPEHRPDVPVRPVRPKGDQKGVNGGGRAGWSAISAGLPSQDESDADQDGDRGTGTPHTGGSGNPPER
jgi:hypothetical protein